MKKLVCLLLALLLSSALAEGSPELTLPNIPAATQERLGEAANAPGSQLVFLSPEDEAVWPMIPAEEDGELCLISTNRGVDISMSAVYTQVEARAGDALQFTVKTSTEAGYDLLRLNVNGETVKVFGGETGWTTYAWAFPEDGAYEIAFVYVKDDAGGAGEDEVYLRGVAHLTGDAAEAALLANPAWPVAEENALTVANPDARRIIFNDPTYALLGVFGLADYWIVPGGEAQLLVTLDAGADPDGAFVQDTYGDEGGGQSRAITPYMTAEGYAFAQPLDTVETTGYAYTTVYLYPAADCLTVDVRTVVLFASEEAAEAFAAQMRGMGYGVAGWEYVQGPAALSSAPATEVLYGLTFIDQQGEFLSGVTVTITAEGFADVMTSDENGGVIFTAPGREYQVHIVRAPEGYVFDADRVWILDVEGGDAIIDLERLEE